MVMLYRSLGRPLGGFLLSALLFAGLAPRAEAGPYSALVVEVESDRVLYQQNPEELRHPASLTKMMTLYLLFEALSQGRIALTDNMVASVHAVSKPPSRLGLKPGDTLTVEEGILGLVTQSANDAATVIAETLGGTEPQFADMMTQKARQLGMTGTVFRNAQGLPDPDQWTTAWDMYRLGKALIKNFPQYYPYFATEKFWYQGHEFHNHNHLLGKHPGVDGIKTGFINSSGFNLVASAKRNGVRLIGVVFGGPSHSRRDAHMREILDDGFAQLDGQPPSVHMAGFDAPAAAKPLMLASADSVNEVSAPARKPRHPSPQPVVKAQPHKAAARPAHRHEAPAKPRAPAPAKAPQPAKGHGGGKQAKGGAAAHPGKPVPAHAAPAHGKGHGKSSSGH
jgi:D-alanyl-D-alanine carboxypeptidase